MITPRFTLEQDENQIKIIIFAPYTNVKDTEITVLEENVYFHSAPYYLRLTLPGKVEETDNSSAKYISDESKFVIHLDKTTPGEVFENLDMLCTFLQPKVKKASTKPLIEDISEPTNSSADSEDEVEENEWFIEQCVEEEMPSASLLQQYKYGFAKTHSGLGSKYEVELGEVGEIQNPDCMSPTERTAKRTEIEKEKFSEDHYLADLMANDDIPDYLEFELKVKSLQKLTDKNRDQLKDLGNRDFLLNKTESKRLYLGLIDILYAYCYDWRVTYGHHCVETPWNISRISATLSWFEVFENIKDVVTSCTRRSLSYPLCRNWDLSMKVFQDTVQILRIGKIGILISLLDVLHIFSSREPYYLLNQLYIQEYCIWVQKMNDSNLNSMITAFEKSVSELTKQEIGFDLCELEIAAKVTQEEDDMYEDMSTNIANVHL